MSTVQVAVAQFAPGESGNVAHIRELVALAASRGAKIVLLPEYSAWFRAPFDEQVSHHAQTIPGPFTTELQSLAREYGVVVVAGLFESSDAPDDTRVYNSVVAVSEAGVQATYRKQHLYDAFGQQESEWIAAGEVSSPDTFVVGGVTFGLMTCYDLRFPELARVITDAGADVILVPAQWARGPLKEHHWLTLLRARAIENTVYIAAADQIPPSGVGRSVVIDPSGIDLAGLGAQEGVAVAPIDLAEIERVRTVNPALALRRYEVRPKS